METGKNKRRICFVLSRLKMYVDITIAKIGSRLNILSQLNRPITKNSAINKGTQIRLRFCPIALANTRFLPISIRFMNAPVYPALPSIKK